MVDGMGRLGSRCPLIARYYCPWSRILARESIIGEKMSNMNSALLVQTHTHTVQLPRKTSMAGGNSLVQYAFL